MPHIDVVTISTGVFSESWRLTDWSVLSAGYPTWHMTISASLLDVHLTSVPSLWGKETTKINKHRTLEQKNQLVIKSTLKDRFGTYRQRYRGVEQVAGVASGHSGVVRIFFSVHHRHRQRQSSVLVTHQQWRATKAQKWEFIKQTFRFNRQNVTAWRHAAGHY